MNGGVSQMDTFDYKPELHRRDGKPFDPGAHVEAPTSAPGNLMKSPFPFRQYGECGRWVSSVFPELAQCVDDLAFLMALSSKTNVHGPASYMMNTGFLMPGFPEHGRVALVWAGLAFGQPSLLSSCFPTPRAFPTTPRGTSPPASCPSHTRERFSRPARRGRFPICFRRRRRRSSPPKASATDGQSSSN